MMRVERTIIGPVLFNTLHKLLLRRGAIIEGQAVSAYGTDRIAVFSMVDTQVTEMVPQYLFMYATGQEITAPWPADVSLLRTVVLAQMVAPKVLVPGQPQVPQLQLTDVHVCRLTPINAEGVPGGKAN